MLFINIKYSYYKKYLYKLKGNSYNTKYVLIDKGVR